MTAVDPETLIEGFRSKLQSQWEQHRKQAFNPNTKGATYEKALKHFLDEYFDGIYSIRTRTAVIDQELKCFDIFNAGESELDVVASFRQAVPEIILESGDMKWVPYDGVAFVCEVKSKLTKSALESDLEKMTKLNEIGRENIHDRFPSRSTGHTQIYSTGEDRQKRDSTKTTINHQLKCLVYDESAISGKALINRLNAYTDIWDLVLIVDEDLIIVSPELPFVEGWYKRTDQYKENGEPTEIFPDILVLRDGIVWFILLISISIPRPPPFDATGALMSLVQRDWIQKQTVYNTNAGFWEDLFTPEELANVLTEDDDN